MFNFLRSRRGQIRGIDFSLAMIIFLLTMSQILVLTNTFIESSRSSQETSKDQSATEAFSSALLESPGIGGTSFEWASIQTSNLGPNWSFGLANNNSEVSPFKLGRLANNSHSNYFLSYSEVKTSLNTSSDFSITTKGTIDAQINTVLQSDPNYTINATIYHEGVAIKNAEVWAFALSGGGTPAQAYALTNENGEIQVTLTQAGAEIVVIIAKYGKAAETMTYQYLQNFSVGTITLLDTADKSLGYNVTAQSNINGDFIALYPSLGVTNSSGPIAGSTVEIGVPQTGLSVIVVSDGAGQIAVTTFPLLLDNVVSDFFEPATLPNSQSSVTQVTRLVRGILLEFTIRLWV